MVAPLLGLAILYLTTSLVTLGSNGKSFPVSVDSFKPLLFKHPLKQQIKRSEFFIIWNAVAKNVGFEYLHVIHLHFLKAHISM